MVDSVTLQLNSQYFKLREQNRFNEAKRQQGVGYSIDTRYCSNYAKSWAKKGVYCPMFGISMKRVNGKEAIGSLEIQSSLPKLVHGTSIFDADISDLDTAYKKILFFLNDLGIDMTIENLRKFGIVRRADFAKMIRLPDYLGRADEVIRILAYFDYKPQSDFRYRDYSHGENGIVIKFWNSTQGYAIYCKFGEILNNGFTNQEKQIQELYKQGRFKNNALKFELSLQRKDSFESVVSRRIKSGKKKDFTLDEIFDRDLAKDILLDAFEKVFSPVAVGLITLSQMEDNKLWAYLDASELIQSKQETLYYWVRMATKFGIAGTWEQMGQKLKGGSVGRYKKEIALTLQELGRISGNTPNLIDFLRAEHIKFEMIRPKSE